MLAFINFLFMFLTYYFLFLEKTYNEQNQEGFIMCQKQPSEVFRKKSFS